MLCDGLAGGVGGGRRACYKQNEGWKKEIESLLVEDVCVGMLRGEEPCKESRCMKGLGSHRQQSDDVPRSN